jgi:hypothetical protein
MEYNLNNFFKWKMTLKKKIMEDILKKNVMEDDLKEEEKMEDDLKKWKMTINNI